MGLGDVAGVLSRFFIVGFFLPSFFGLVALAQLLTSGLLPDGYEGYSGGTQILILGGAALLTGLFLLGLHRPLIRLFEGYPIARARLARPFVRLQERSFDRLTAVKAAGGPDADHATNSLAMRAWLKLDRFFPDNRSRLLPTRFGNALRAAEDYPYTRWGLDSIPFWARVEPLLSDQERQLHENARTDVAFFLNSTLAAAAVGIVLVVDAALNAPIAGRYAWIYLAPFLVAYLVYRFSIDAGQRWGVELKASLDLHRLAVYDRLGVRRPTGFADEKTTIAPALNRFFLYGIAMPDDLWAREPPNGGGEA